MKLAAWMPFGAMAVNMFMLLGTQLPAVAAQFGQTEVDQSKFVAVAVPRANNFYGLTIIEQISNQRSCWQETGQRPTKIDPLLLNFNFSGICGRSADSNGYSIRHNGTDLGLKYRLSLQARRNEVVLLGVPQSGGGTVELGRTHGLSSSLMKIDLDPGWKFAKRNYQGKTLGHIYLTKQGGWPTGGARTIAQRPSHTQKFSRTQRLSQRGRPLPPTLSKSSSRASLGSQRSTSRRYRLYVYARNSAQADLVRRLVPGSFRSTYRGQAVMQAGLFSDKSKAKTLSKQLSRSGLKTTLISEKGRVPAPRSTFSSVPVSGSVLRVPSGKIPLGNTGGSGSVYGRGAPPPPPNATLALAPRYKVLVPAGTSGQQRRIRSLVPDAFRSSYRGRSAMQVGSFSNMAEAQAVIQLMKRNGLNPYVEQSL